MAQVLTLEKCAPGLLKPATIIDVDFINKVKVGDAVCGEFKQSRNYKFHKRFFKLLQLGFDYWTPTGGAVTPNEQQLINGFVDFLCKQVGAGHNLALADAAELYLADVGLHRVSDIALLKSFDAFREWVTVQAGYYTEHVYPDGSKNRRAKSISFARMDEDMFQQLYKAVLNVLWNWILFRKFQSIEEAENIAAQLLEYA
ncbi:hypothetical protein C9426_22090 [Serratia sp. S1B]|nr:hypothetical protein C9426_22090 [Serratia sp. S1B]